MEIITMKLVDLVKPEKNVRIHTEQQLKEFQRSVKMFGQIRPIVVDENNVILAGNGLYETLIAMGKETADVYKYDNLTENQKKKLMIADNKIFSLGIENLDTLNSFLEDLQGDLDIPGFDEDILRQRMLQKSSPSMELWMMKKSRALKKAEREKNSRFKKRRRSRQHQHRSRLLSHNRKCQRTVKIPPK